MSTMSTQPTIHVRFATKEDAPFILEMVRELAIYEKAADAVHATVEGFEKWLFEQPVAECLVGLIDGVPRGIALFFVNFSTWESGPGLYLEDLYVQQDFRGHGLGKALFSKLAQLAVERNYCRITWACLDWNTPSLEFYRSLGATQKSDWITHQLKEPDFLRLINPEL